MRVYKVAARYLKAQREHRMAVGDEIGLWKYNKVTGSWVLERMCAPDTKDRWLKIFQKDEPDEIFVLSKRKPKGKPKTGTPEKDE